MMGDGGWAWMMLPAPVVMILFLLAVVVLVAVVLRRLDGHAFPGAGHAAAPGPRGGLIQRKVSRADPDLG